METRVRVLKTVFRTIFPCLAALRAIKVTEKPQTCSLKGRRLIREHKFTEPPVWSTTPPSLPPCLVKIYFSSQPSSTLKLQDGGHTFREEVLSVRSPRIHQHCRLANRLLLFGPSRRWELCDKLESLWIVTQRNSFPEWIFPNNFPIFTKRRQTKLNSCRVFNPVLRPKG